MEPKKGHQRINITTKQKKKLIELVAKHPELITCKVTPGFNYRDSQKLWQSIAQECNSLHGAVKTWKQWRKTWQDLRSKTKKRQFLSGPRQATEVSLTETEQEALGLRNSPTNEDQETTEFIQLDLDNVEDSNFHLEMDSAPSYSEPDSPPEAKVFTNSVHKSKVKKYNSKRKHSDNCMLNCDVLALQEQRKIQLKQDYINFKKDYLRQKLQLIREQTEALKSIAKELSEK